MEKVYLTPSDIQEIGKGNIPTLDDFNEVWKHITLHGFIFDGFWIICEHNNTKYQVVIDKAIDFLPVVKIKKVWYDNDNLAHHKNITMPIYQYRIKYVELMNNDNAIDPDFEEAALPMMFIQYVTYVMLHREIEIIEPEIRTSTTSTTTRSSNKNPRYSLTSVVKQYRHKNKNRTYEYHVESYPRRATVRHLKSGKVVPVSGSICRPKKKGTGTSNKDYRL